MSVSELTRDSGAPRSSSLDFDEAQSLVGLKSPQDDFGEQNVQRLNWEPSPLAHLWQIWQKGSALTNNRGYTHRC